MSDDDNDGDDSDGNDDDEKMEPEMKATMIMMMTTVQGLFIDLCRYLELP